MLLSNILKFNETKKICNLNQLPISIGKINGYFLQKEMIFDLNDNRLVVLKDKVTLRVIAIPNSEFENIQSDYNHIFEIKAFADKYYYDGHGGHDYKRTEEVFYLVSDKSTLEHKETEQLIESLHPEMGYIKVISINI